MVHVVFTLVDLAEQRQNQLAIRVLQSIEQKFLPIESPMDDSYVLIDGPHRTPPVTPDQGVKQGCPISPLLFALYVHDISKEFLGPVDAVRVQGTPVTHFMYADDLTLVSTSSHGLQRLVCQLQGFADRKHLTVNVGKSKVMVFNGNSQTAAPRIGYKHEILPVVREFKYLGMHFNPSATPAFAATHMRAGMFLAMRQACKRAREYGVLHDPYALCHLIRAFVLPLGLYGSQVWGTAFLGHGVQLSNPVQTRMLSFLSDLLMRVIKADVELGRSCQASWSAQFQLAAKELMGGEFTLSPDMVLGTKAMEVKWLESFAQLGGTDVLARRHAAKLVFDELPQDAIASRLQLLYTSLTGHLTPRIEEHLARVYRPVPITNAGCETALKPLSSSRVDRMGAAQVAAHVKAHTEPLHTWYQYITEDSLAANRAAKRRRVADAKAPSCVLVATPINTTASPLLSAATQPNSPNPAPTLVPIPTATPSYATRAGAATVTRKLQEQQRREKRAAAELSIPMKLASAEARQQYRATAAEQQAAAKEQANTRARMATQQLQVIAMYRSMIQPLPQNTLKLRACFAQLGGTDVLARRHAAKLVFDELPQDAIASRLQLLYTSLTGHLTPRIEEHLARVYRPVPITNAGCETALKPLSSSRVDRMGAAQVAAHVKAHTEPLHTWYQYITEDSLAANRAAKRRRVADAKAPSCVLVATPINTTASPLLSAATQPNSPNPAPTLVPIPTATPSYATRAGAATVTRKLQEQQRREKRAAAELSIPMKLASAEARQQYRATAAEQQAAAKEQANTRARMATQQLQVIAMYRSMIQPLPQNTLKLRAW
ncbi:hypothetical protein QJQ45_012319 [Haematococcus lacustris]|nr:hypothetical protein QJQ45_012319 [Haematococcus lacustris]